MLEVGSEKFRFTVELYMKDGSFEGFEADDINTEDVGYIDFYLRENLIISANRDMVKIFKLNHKTKETNDNS
jgi:hypothetical protein